MLTFSINAKGNLNRRETTAVLTLRVQSMAGFCSATPLIRESTLSPTWYNYPLNGGNRVIDLCRLIS